MRRGSVKRPILAYCLIFSLGLAAAIAVYASLALLSVQRRAHEEILRQKIEVAATGPSLTAVREQLERTEERLDLGLFVVTATAGPTSVEKARATVDAPPNDAGWLAVTVRAPGPEAYVVYHVDPRRALAGTRGRIQRLFVFALAAGIAAGLLLFVMVARLVMPQLTTLRTIAEDALADEESLSSDQAPNEIAAIARAFRSNVRTLRSERATIEAQHRELEQMQNSLVRASKLASVGRLAAGIAHEIGNPLSAVLGYLSLLKMDDLAPKERTEILDRSSRQLDRIHETIRKLLTYARPDEAREAPGPLAPGPIVRETTALLASHPLLRDVELVDETDGSATPSALGHAGPLGQVLVNLILNAGHALGDQEIKRIRIYETGDEDWVSIHVEDSGPGISEEHLEHLFDPFFTTKPPGEGTGLGLAVSRSIMEAMGGDLVVSTTSEDGSTFTIHMRSVDSEVARASIPPPGLA